MSVPRSRDEIPPDVPQPAGLVCAFVSGSLVAGWGHANSDVDLYLVTEEPPAISPTAYLDLGLSKQPIPVVVAYDPTGRRWDVEYWTTGQVDDLIEGVSGDGARYLASRLSYADVDCFHRISIGVALAGGPWLAETQHRLTASALPRVLASREFAEADGFVDDAVGMLAAGDRHSAVLAASRALGHAVDGYLAARGSFAPNTKWRYRKLSALADPALPPDRYWRLETMRDLDPDDPARWVEAVVETCQALILEVDFS